MKPAAFAYEAPRSLGEALTLLGEEARPLAGGQSLIPMLNFRLARPALLVDLNRITALSYVRRSGGVLRIGALARQAVIERSELIGRDWPLLTQAVRLVGHPAIRSRGTVAGSVAHADPKAELPAALLALGARFHARSPAGERVLAAEDLFLGPFRTALADDELLTEIEVPPPPPGARCRFVEHARTHGDFALAGAAVVLAPGEHAAIALIGAASTPVRAVEAERALIGGASAGEVGEVAAGTVADGHRRALIASVVRRAVEGLAG